MDHQLLFELLQRMALAATLAFILSQTKMFRRLVYLQVKLSDRLLLGGIFGVLGIFGTYAGVPVYDALANIRVIGVMAAGLNGGPLLGLLAGMIAGGHRYFLGGFSAFACAVSSILEGVLAGLIYMVSPRKPLPWWVGFVAGFVGELMQMGIILLLAKPYDLAETLVNEIAVPMTIVNAFGLSVFMLIIRTAIEAQDKVGAEQSQKALDIATKTLPYLRRGLNRDSAMATVQIIYDTSNFDSVAITDHAHVLAFMGAEVSHHSPERGTLTEATKQTLATGQLFIAHHKEDIGCSHPGCKLSCAIVVPLLRAGKTIGTLKLYSTRRNAISEHDKVFAVGLGHLFSTQLELTEIDRQAKLAANAELRALQSQINPHFLFNTLNTITSLVRTQPNLARELLLKLASLFRYTLRKTGQNISLKEELEQMNAYLTIEKARHGDKLKVKEEVDESLLSVLIPSLVIQPLVENAIKHGLQPKEAGGTIQITVKTVGQDVHIVICDDGVGIDLECHHPLRNRSGGGIGLLNVHERLQGLFGQEYGLTIESELGQGTTITMKVPLICKQEVDDNV